MTLQLITVGVVIGLACIQNISASGDTDSQTTAWNGRDFPEVKYPLPLSKNETEPLFHMHTRDKRQTAPRDTSIMVISESATIAAGSMGMFVCVASGYPVPSLTWNKDGTPLRDGIPLSNGSRSTIYEELVVANRKTFVQSILVICSLEQDDAAQYNCSASNSVSSASASFNLTVNQADCGRPPIIFNGTMSYQNTTVGSEVHYHWATLEGELTAICREDGRWSFTHVCGSYSGIIATITAITVPISCVVSFIIGALVGAVIHYCAMRKKHYRVDERKTPTEPPIQLKKIPEAVYENIDDVQSPQNIDLKENTAYASLAKS